MEVLSNLSPSKGLITLKHNQIQTLIFMDFETTGLIPPNPEDVRATPGDKTRSIANLVTRCINVHDNPVQMPQITEMAFVSVPRQLFMSAIEELHSEAILDEQQPLIRKLPTNIYASQVRPNLTTKEWQDYETARGKCAAMHLRQTDLRILYAELARNQLLEEYPLPEGIFFLDSYLAFMDIERSHFDNLSITMTNIDWERVTTVVDVAKRSMSAVKEETEEIPNSAEDDDGNIVADSQDTEVTTSENLASMVTNHGMITPQKQTGHSEVPSGSSSGFKRRLIFDEDHDDDTLPLSFINKGNWSPAKRRRMEKGFFRKVTEAQWDINEIRVRDYFFKGNFKLENLYKQITKGTYDAHYALDDCHALLQVCLGYGDDFLNYLDRRKEKIPKFHLSKTYPLPNGEESIA